MNNVIVDSKIHKNTSVIRGHGSEFGENVHFVPVIADELRQLMLEYPCCLLKNNQTGQFGLHALLGFEPGENLFLNDKGWSSQYIPLHIRRQPFMVGYTSMEDAPNAKNTVLTIDMDNKRVVNTDTDIDTDTDMQQHAAHLLFDGNGQPTEYLKQMNKMVFDLAQGIVRTEQFVAVLVEHDLIESIQLGVSIKQRLQRGMNESDRQIEKINFDGLYVINEQKLAALSGDLLNQLHQNGYLQACYLIAGSMGQIQKMIAMRNEG
ncbi:SapC family protein [Shewanella olleyana]|uniref:SapC family protein n=1 Tax=Shewanella olleyana TaxID=135626 RepID=UPI00200D09C0|nr:SapC family protein [Shewanella olleyana]MCL1065637.1 SapC family protein [Shewanella olleyana]